MLRKQNFFIPTMFFTLALLIVSTFGFSSVANAATTVIASGAFGSGEGISKDGNGNVVLWGNGNNFYDFSSSGSIVKSQAGSCGNGNVMSQDQQTEQTYYYYKNACTGAATIYGYDQNLTGSPISISSSYPLIAKFQNGNRIGLEDQPGNGYWQYWQIYSSNWTVIASNSSQMQTTNPWEDDQPIGLVILDNGNALFADANGHYMIVNENGGLVQHGAFTRQYNVNASFIPVGSTVMRKLSDGQILIGDAIYDQTMNFIRRLNLPASLGTPSVSSLTVLPTGQVFISYVSDDWALFDPNTGNMLINGKWGSGAPYASIYVEAFNDGSNRVMLMQSGVGYEILQLDHPPTVTSTNANGGFYSPTVSGRNTLTLSGVANDLDVGDQVTVFYQIDNGTPVQITSFTSNGSNLPYSTQVNISSSFAEGWHVAHVYAMDNFGARSEPTSVDTNFEVDKTSPSVSISAPPSGWQPSANVNISVSDSGGSNIAVQNYAVTKSTSKPTTGWQPVTSPINLTAEGIWYVHVDAVDQAGNETWTYSGPFYIDGTAPQWSNGNGLVLNNGNDYTSSQTIPVEINATDGGSGITKVLLSTDNLSWTTYSVSPTLTNATNYTVTSFKLPPGSGQKTIYAKLVDGNGNVSSTQTGYVGLQVNTTPPTVSLAINGGQPQTTSQTVTLTVMAADPGYTNDQLTMSFSNDGQSWTTPVAFHSTSSYTLPSTTSNNYPIFVRVSDPAANTGIGYSSIYYLNNTTAPTVGGSGTVGGTIGGSYPTTTYDGNSNVYVVKGNQVSLDFSQSGASYVSVSTDDISFSSLYDDTKPFTIQLPAGDGLKTVYAELASTNNKSALGAAGDVYFLVDSTAPTLTVTGANGSTATSGSSFNVQLDAKDNLASLMQMQYQVDGGAWQSIPSNGQVSITGFTAHSGRHTSTITVEDLAGNTVSEQISFWSL